MGLTFGRYSILDVPARSAPVYEHHLQRKAMICGLYSILLFLLETFRVYRIEFHVYLEPENHGSEGFDACGKELFPGSVHFRDMQNPSGQGFEEKPYPYYCSI
jgi:hypothetical protein